MKMTDFRSLRFDNPVKIGDRQIPKVVLDILNAAELEIPDSKHVIPTHVIDEKFKDKSTAEKIALKGALHACGLIVA
jgi:hypothetical protein